MGTGTFLSAIPWNASWDAEVQSECADALTAWGKSGFSLAASGLNLVTAWTVNITGSLTGNITGNLSGSVASVTGGVTLADNAITAAKFDESTAFPLKSADTGTTQVARTGADGDTLETISDEIAGVGSSGLSLTDVISDGQTANTVGKALENALDYLDRAISDVGGTAGSGSNSCTLTVNDDGGSPVEGVAVWVTTDEAGTNVVAGTEYTDASGEVPFLLDDGTYYCWKQHSDHTFTNPQSFTVAG